MSTSLRLVGMRKGVHRGRTTSTSPMTNTTRCLASGSLAFLMTTCLWPQSRCGSATRNLVPFATQLNVCLHCRALWQRSRVGCEAESAAHVQTACGHKAVRSKDLQQSCKDGHARREVSPLRRSMQHHSVQLECPLVWVESSAQLRPCLRTLLLTGLAIVRQLFAFGTSATRTRKGRRQSCRDL